jgi:hypothetical protein
MHIKINQDTTKEYPYDKNKVRKDFPNVSFPTLLNNTTLAEFNVFEVIDVAPPSYDKYTESISEPDPIQINGIWTRQWLVTPLSAEETTNILNQTRRRIWREIKDIRDDKIRNGGVLLVDKWYPTTTDAKAQILWVITMGSSAPNSQRIELMDGSMNNLSYNRANDLLAAAAAQAAAITDYADSLKVLVDAAADPESISITTGWPAVYEGT